MNELIIPPAPLWYKNLAVACAPDNTLVYGAKNDIVVVRDRGAGELAEIKFIQAAHSKYITSVSLNKKWKNPNAYAVTLGEEGVLKVWNLETLEKKTSNKIHDDHKHTVVGAVFAGDDRVVSASARGYVVVWNINTNETKQLKDLFNANVTLTCLSSCPHAGWLLAFGLNNGCVVVADLRRNGQVLYRLRGHYQSVVSLSWCPAPVNIFPRHVQNIVKNKTAETTDKDVEQQEPEVEKVDKPNPWINLTHADEETPQPDPLEQSVNNFLQECEDLRARIMNLDISSATNGVQNSETETECSPVNKEEGQGDSVDLESEEKGIEEIRESKLDSNRPFPQIFDPSSGDFLDDSVDVGVVEILEDKDVGNEKSEDKTDAPCPETSTVTIEEEEPRVEYLLASSAKDRTVYIWRAGTDGRMQTFFRTPKRGKNRDAKNCSYWVSLCWITPDTILTSSIVGEILAWPLPKPKESNKLYRVIHSEHCSTVFNIITPPRCLSAYNWRDNIGKTFWSWGHEGLLINYDLNEGKVLFSCYAMTASATCLESSCLDPNRLAVGIRDGSIRVWDFSVPQGNIISMTRFHDKVLHKVSTIAWNPLQEMVLGFGTEEGRVGLLNTNSKSSTLFPHYFHDIVYKVEWGPTDGDINKLSLYAVAEGKIAIYNTKTPTEGPIQLQLSEELYVYKFAWKPDFSLLLINGKDGSLIILNINLVPITTVYLNEKGFNAMIWHPDAFTNKSETFHRCNWLAASTTKGLLVYDCGKHTGNESSSENALENIVVRLGGHLKPTMFLAWCPFDGNRIVSVAGDGLAHVWDVLSKSAIATFVDSFICHNPVVIWNPTDADSVITGGEKVIRAWKVSNNPPKIDEEFMASRKRFLAKAIKVESNKTEKDKIQINIPQMSSYPKNCIVPPLYASSEENMAAQVATMKELMMAHNDTVVGDNKHNLNPLQLFGEKDDISQLLAANYEEQKRAGKYKCCELISLWKGNIGEYIKDAINENRVTPTIISLAPMVSLKLWQEASESYATKLSEKPDCNPLEIATYYLVCHKIEEAINCLCEGSMFKEALALAKHRLPESSDVPLKITEQWTEHCIGTGNFETAAFCYISLKQYENAAKVLGRRNNKEFLEFAAELAEKSGNKKLCDSIKFKCSELISGKLLEETAADSELGLAVANNGTEEISELDQTKECETSLEANQ